MKLGCQTSYVIQLDSSDFRGISDVHCSLACVVLSVHNRKWFNRFVFLQWWRKVIKRNNFRCNLKALLCIIALMRKSHRWQNVYYATMRDVFIHILSFNHLLGYGTTPFWYSARTTEVVQFMEDTTGLFEDRKRHYGREGLEELDLSTAIC